MIWTWRQSIAFFVGMAALIWQVLLLFPVFVLEGWVVHKVNRARCALGIQAAVADIQRDVDAGGDPLASWAQHHPGPCHGPGGEDDAYLFLADGLSDTGVPVIICRPASHLSTSVGICGFGLANRPDPRVHAGFAGGDVMTVPGDETIALLGELKASGVVGYDGHGVPAALNSPDPTGRSWAIHLDPNGSLYHPLIIVLLAAVVYHFSARRDKPDP